MEEGEICGFTSEKRHISFDQEVIPYAPKDKRYHEMTPGKLLKNELEKMRRTYWINSNFKQKTFNHCGTSDTETPVYIGEFHSKINEYTSIPKTGTIRRVFIFAS